MHVQAGDRPNAANPTNVNMTRVTGLALAIGLELFVTIANVAVANERRLSREVRVNRGSGHG